MQQQMTFFDFIVMSGHTLYCVCFRFRTIPVTTALPLTSISSVRSVGRASLQLGNRRLRPDFPSLAMSLFGNTRVRTGPSEAGIDSIC